MPEFSGSCLCGAVAYKGSSDELRTMNCHCTDCQKASGAVYTTNIFVPETDIEISGDVPSFSHESDRGSIMTKHSCIQCGSPVYGTNSNREGIVTLRAGTMDQKELIKPGAYVFCDSKVPSTPLDGNLRAFDRMPG